MSAWIDRLTSSRTTHTLQIAARFAEERQRVLAENVANIDTPDYISRRLDAKSFQHSLRAAIDSARSASSDKLDLRDNPQAQTDSHGALKVTPADEPASNALFHDGTNAKMESLLTDAQDNSLYYNVTTSLLKNEFDGLLHAIRGRMT